MQRKSVFLDRAKTDPPLLGPVWTKPRWLLSGSVRLICRE